MIIAVINCCQSTAEMEAMAELEQVQTSSIKGRFRYLRRVSRNSDRSDSEFSLA